VSQAIYVLLNVSFPWLLIQITGLNVTNSAYCTSDMGCKYHRAVTLALVVFIKNDNFPRC